MLNTRATPKSVPAVALTMLLATVAPTYAADYLGPIDVLVSPDGRELYVLQADTPSISVVDVDSEKVTRKVDLPATPHGAALSPSGDIAYVTCDGASGVVVSLDLNSGKAGRAVPVGHTPTAPVLSKDGTTLYVCNRFDNDVSVIDVSKAQTIRRIPVIREPVAAASSPDGSRIFVANLLPNDPADAYDVAAELSVIDTTEFTATSVRLPNGSSSVRGLCVSPDGDYLYAVHLLSRYQIPTTQLERGWINTNALSILDARNLTWINTVLLDDVDLGAANPWDVAVVDGGSRIAVSHAGTHELSLIDAEALHDKLASLPRTMAEARQRGTDAYSTRTASDVQNDLSFLTGIRQRINLQRAASSEGDDPASLRINGARGMAVAADRVYVAMYFSDLLSVVDLQDESLSPVHLIPLGPTPKLTTQRLGQLYFNDGNFCFQNWLSCESCHPDARVDALNWDLLNDGLGNPKNARSMLLAHQTPPVMSTGIRADAETAVRAGLRHIQFSVRPNEDAMAIDEYLKSLVPVPSPHLANGELSDAARRGKDLFFSEEINCGKCHPEPLYTDLKMHNVHSRGKYDRRSDFDTPTLIEVWRTAPYLHTGQYTTVLQLLRDGRHGENLHSLDGLSEQQLADLAEFVLSL